MPDADGLALAAKLREQSELAATRIILLTSGDRPGDLVRSRELRVEAHLLKPVQQGELLEAIYMVMSRVDGEAVAARPAPAQESMPSPSPAVTPLRILVAEDNEFNKQHVERLLARLGHKVRLANNGREALALLGISGQQSGASPSPTPGPVPLTSGPDPNPLTLAFDLLLLDLQMPELDGLQVVRAIREWERAAGGHLPVIALTARSRREDRERCLAAGMDDYLAKPVRSAELFAAIERVDSCQRVPEISRPDAGDGTRLLDPVVLLAACGDEAEGLREMCRRLAVLSAGPTGRGGRCPPDLGRAAATRGRPQALWPAIGVLDGGRRRGIRPRRSGGWRAARRVPEPGGTARSDGAGTHRAGGWPVDRRPALPGQGYRRPRPDVQTLELIKD